MKFRNPSIPLQKEIQELLDITIGEKASDLHLSVGQPPILRISGGLVPLSKKPPITAQFTEEFAQALLTEEQRAKLARDREIDFSYNLEERGARFRGNIFYTMGNLSIALRFIPQDILTIEELNLPSVLHQFTRASQGFVIIAGPSGHGKSTTLASIVDEINRTRAEHIITIEDPIEYVFRDDKSVIDQREVTKDTKNFASALRATFRQDPNVIMVGEMRDAETIATALTAAETGHLVFATLHTNSAAQTVHRIVDSFPAEQQGQIRAQLSGSLLGVVSQRLLPRNQGGLIPACEVLMVNAAAANLIRENKVHELPLVIETSAEEGMISLNRALAALAKIREITMENALRYSLNPAELRTLVRG
ncbi:MAG: twitching motility protein [Parcubacteria group bacterium GW2011_GWB1_49_12]|nr:MAG: twitching motility protein [Parcubacteria group bacterium GW2011_GWB1_49_12]OHA65780.1 MAG: type IV pili twitching motility protein PilT [Candidatus Wildermuthbacteria bacterium RIFCSPHIGHO2_01_FULL_50_47]OHA69683.1 MAG: type IV pili twitching motility protein PilT [Candidatus Wildermuthbacteria bacterium RIFCSPHIGHO2_02_FULL_49_17]